MPVESQVIQTSLITFGSFWFLVKIGLLTLSALYFVFSLIVVRQVYFMTETLITETAGLLRAFAIIHAGLALGVIILFIGLSF